MTRMLPKIDAPTYTMNLESGQEIHYNPFTVREERTLLISMESKDPKEITNAVLQILRNCIQEDIVVEDLPVFDIENIFLNLRKVSIGQEIELTFLLNKCKKSGCTNQIKLQIDLAEIDLVRDPDHTKTIQLTDNIGIVMRYPTVSMINADAESKMQSGFDMILSCVDSIFTADETFKAKDVPKEEIEDFVNSLSRDQFKKIEKFFETSPKITKTFPVICDKCGAEDEIILSGLQSFLA
jgi:hypothetical protein